jgi:hypothetical protein
VRLAGHNPAVGLTSIYSGDATSENFVSVPAVQLPDDEWVQNDMDLWVNPQPDSDGDHDALLSEISCYENHTLPEGSSASKFGHRGHVTLLK